MLIDKNRYKKSLSDLWHRVFGDDYSYIELIFNEKYEKDLLCFAELENEKAVAAFYLIKNTLKFNGEAFDGFYLYAAATLPEYRKKGLMSKLINEAQEYCRSNGFDYVSLVPSSDSLYSYYSRFGFKAAMHRIESRKPDLKQVLTSNEILDDINLFDVRSGYKGNLMNFSKLSFGYALDCLNSAEYKIIPVSSDSYVIYSKKDKVVSEFISPYDKLEENTQKLLGMINDNDVTVYSPFKLNGFAYSEAKRYGMLCPINKKLKRDWKYTDIYMNIALD